MQASGQIWILISLASIAASLTWIVVCDWVTARSEPRDQAPQIH